MAQPLNTSYKNVAGKRKPAQDSVEEQNSVRKNFREDLFTCLKSDPMEALHVYVRNYVTVSVYSFFLGLPDSADQRCQLK